MNILKVVCLLLCIVISLLGCSKEYATYSYEDFSCEWPAQWSEKIELKKMVCNINSEVTIKEKYVPETYICKQEPFSASDIDTIVDYFTESAVGMAELTRTKRDILEEIKDIEILIQRGEIDALEGESYISDLQKELAITPEEEFSAPYSITFLPCIYLYLNNDNQRIYVGADTSGIQVNIGHNNMVIRHDNQNYPEFYGEHTLDMQDAINMALPILNDLNIDLTYVNGEPAVIQNALGETITQGWYLTFAPSTENGIPIDLYGCASLVNNSKYDYSAPWFAESAFMFIDESGVRQFAWYDRMNIIKQKKTNSLLSFEEIKNELKKYIKYCLQWTEDVDIGDLEYEFYELKLTNILVPVKDDPNLAAFTPAWVLYANEKRGSHISGPYILCLDATNGKRLDPFSRR